MKTAHDFDQELLILFDAYVHGAIDRRTFLKSMAGVGAGAAFPESIRKALAIKPNTETGTIQDVKHIVVLMQENRSFDHYFGTLRGVRGFQDPRAVRLSNGNSVFQQPNEIIVGHRDEPNQILQRATAGFSEDVAGFTDYPGGHPEGFPDSHKMHYRAVYEHIASGRTTPALFATVEDGHHEVQLCEAIAKSSVAGKWVKV
jgi:hypothetical protein